jgi:hypothetical protein
VLTGEYTNGNSGMRIPPQKPSPAGTHILYDCVVDNEGSGRFINHEHHFLKGSGRFINHEHHVLKGSGRFINHEHHF